MKFPKIPINYKLVFLVFLVSSIILALGIYGTSELGNMEQNTKVIFFDELLSLDYLTTMRYGYTDGIQNTIRAYHDHTISLDSAKRRLVVEQRKIDIGWSAYKGTLLVPKEKYLIRICEPLIRQTDTLLLKLLSADLSQRDSADAEALNRTIAILMPDLQRLIKLQITVSDEYYQKNQSVHKVTARNFKIMAMVTLVIAFSISILILRDTRMLIFSLEKTNRDLKENQLKYRYLFDHAPAHIIIWDPATLKVLEVNDMAKMAYGHGEREWKDMSIADFRPSEDQAELIQSASDITQGVGYPLEGIRRHIMKDGHVHYMYIVAHIIQYEGRKAVMTLAEDVTERYLAEENVRIMNEHIKGLNKHMETVREEERARLAREIHDELGQYVTILKMDISWIDKKLNITDPDIRERFTKIYEHIGTTVNNIRRIITDLRPPLLDDAGILSTIEWHLTGVEARTGIKCTLSASDTELRIGQSESIVIYRIYQEAITNILKHAQATAITVVIRISDGVFRMCIRDNGVGFDPDKAASGPTYGILGMKERAASLQGGIYIDSTAGGSTSIIMVIPLSDTDI